MFITKVPGLINCPENFTTNAAWNKTGQAHKATKWQNPVLSRQIYSNYTAILPYTYLGRVLRGEDGGRREERSDVMYCIVSVRTDLANRPTEPMLVSFDAWYTKLWGNCGFLQSGSRQTTPVRVGVTCGSGISIVWVDRIKRLR